MKIIALRLLNLNSLRGAQEILFEEPPLAYTGLFAITGPTGAGKSTLLDALTLALYGYAPRFGRESPTEIMARHTGQCYAEVDFRVGTREYRSRWDLWRANNRPNGKLQPPKMALAILPEGEIIAEKMDQVRQQVTEITGLDYPRFLRSVLLAQGDFAAFLKADENERGELLEKITGTDLYTRLSRLAFEKEKEKRLHLEGLERNLNQSRLLPDDEVQRQKAALESGLVQLQALSEEKDRLAADVQWLERIRELRSQAQQLDHEMEKALAARENSAGEKHRYEKHLRAAGFAPAYREAILLREREGTLHRQLLELRQSLRPLEETAAAAKAAEAAARLELHQQTREGVEKEPLLREGDELYHERQQTALQYQKLKADWDHQKKQVQESNAAKETIVTQVAGLIQRRSKLTTFLADNAGDECLEGDARSFESNLGLLVEKVHRLRAVAGEVKRKEGDENLLERLMAENRAVLADYKKQLDWKERQIEAIRLDIKAIISEQADASLESRLSQLGNQRVILSNQITFARHYVSTSQEIEKLNNELYQREQEANSLATDLEKLQGQHRQAQAEYSLLVRLCEADQKIMNLEAARRQLEPGKPCPLCGSVHHPFAEDGYQPQLSENEQKRDRKWHEIGELEVQVRDLKDRIGFLKAFRDNSMQQLQTLSRDVVKAESEFEKFRREAGNPYQIGEPEKIQSLFKSVEAEATKLTALQQELRDKKNALEEHRRQRDELTGQYTTLHTQQQVNEEKWANLRNDRERLRQEEENFLAEAAEIRTALKGDVQKYGLTLPLPDSEGLWLEAVRRRADRYKHAQEENRTLETELNEYQMQLARLEERLHQQTESARHREAEMNGVLQLGQQIKGRITGLALKLGISADDLRESPFGRERRRLAQALLDAQEAIDQVQGAVMKGESALASRLGQIGETETQLVYTAREAAEKWAALLRDLQAAGFGSPEEFTGSLLSPAEEGRLKAEQEDLQKWINQIEGAIARNSKELVELTAQIRTDTPMEAISAQLVEVKSKEKELVDSLAAIRHALKENDRILEQFAGLSRQIAEGRTEYHRWFTLSDLIGSASGDKFRKFAQGLALEQLVDLANDHLLKLNPRYQIGRTPGTDLGLDVVDRYQADNVRPVKSLSGGETFLVSLSLALGLSDMAGSKTRIESLFIDEGFGTLDAETLDTALSTLENLQATGKLIGIISHVEALKDRLTTQIQVVRQSGGVSRIRIGN